MYQIDFNDDDEEEEDIYKRWSLELIDHHGNLHDITLSKGDLFIFEVIFFSIHLYYHIVIIL